MNVAPAIFVFPISVDRASGSNGRTFTEHNISTYIEKLADKPCYVIYAQLTGTDSPYIEFMMKGHYFKLSEPTSSINILNKKPLYAAIKIVNSGDFKVLGGSDTDDGYTGVAFSTEELDTTEYTTLQLLDANGAVPIDSYFRYTQNVVENICGGTV